MTNTVNKKSNSYVKVVSFLLMQVLAVLSFSLGNSFIFSSILSVVAAILIVLVTRKNIKSEGLSNFAYFLFPLVIYGLLSIVSNFVLDPSFVLGSGPTRFIIPLAFVAIAVCGYFISSAQEFKISTALLVIYSCLAAYVFINLAVTMVQYEPFYTINYSDYYIYYDGQRASVPIGEMAYALNGFTFKEVSIEYFSFFPLVLLSSGLVLFFIKYNENKKIYLCYLGFFLLALITLILTINLLTILALLLSLLVMALILLIIKQKIKGKVLKYGLIIFFLLFTVAFVILVLCSQCGFAEPIMGGKIKEFIDNNAILSKLFNNRIVAKFKVILDGIFNQNKIFGFPTLDRYYVPEHDLPLNFSGSWLFDNFMTSGVFGSIAFIGMLVFGIKNLVTYYKNSNDNKPEKVLLIAFIAGLLSSGIILYDGSPFIFESTLTPIYLSGPFMIMVFLFSYTYKSFKATNKKEENKKEEVTNEEQEITL